MKRIFRSLVLSLDVALIAVPAWIILKKRRA